MAEWSERAFDMLADATKQVLTLSAGIVAITITFIKDFVPNATHGVRILMAVSWGLYLLSILIGIWLLINLAGLQQVGADREQSPPTIHDLRIRTYIFAQFIFFFLALCVTVVAGILAL